MFFPQLGARQFDSGFFVGARGVMVKLVGACGVAAFAVEVAVSLEGFGALRDEVEELAAFERVVEMLFAGGEVAAIEMAAREVEIRPSLLRDGRRVAVFAEHPPEPAHRLGEVAANHGGQAQIVRDEVHVVRVVLLFGELERGAKLALGGSPFGHREVTQPARVAALDANRRLFADEFERAVQIRERARAIAATARDGGERVQRFGLAFGVAAIMEERGGAAKRRLRSFILAAQARDFGAVKERARVRFDGRFGQRFDKRDERRERARRDPLLPFVGDDDGGARELFRREQVADSLLPLLAFDEEVGAAQMLARHSRLPDLRAQTATQKIPEQRVQAILLAAPVAARHRHKDVATHERGQQLRATSVRVETTANLHFHAIQKRDAQEQTLRVLRFVCENFFGEVVEDV